MPVSIEAVVESFPTKRETLKTKKGQEIFEGCTRVSKSSQGGMQSSSKE